MCVGWWWWCSTIIYVQINEAESEWKRKRRYEKRHKIYGLTTAYVNSRLWHKSFDALLSRAIQGNSLHLCSENECIWSDFANATNTAHSEGSRCHRLSFIWNVKRPICHTAIQTISRSSGSVHANASEIWMLIKLSQSWHFRDTCVGATNL